MLCARSQSDSTSAPGGFTSSAWAPYRGRLPPGFPGGIAAECGSSSRFLGVRMSNRKKTMVMNPNIAIGPGLKSRNLIRVSKSESTNPVVKTTRATLVCDIRPSGSGCWKSVAGLVREFERRLARRWLSPKPRDRRRREATPRIPVEETAGRTSDSAPSRPSRGRRHQAGRGSAGRNESEFQRVRKSHWCSAGHPPLDRGFERFMAYIVTRLYRNWAVGSQGRFAVLPG